MFALNDSYCELGSEPGVRDTVDVRHGPCHQRATASLQNLFPSCPPLQGNAFLGLSPFQSCCSKLDVAWLCLRSSKCPVSVSGTTLSIAVHCRLEPPLFNVIRNHSAEYSASLCLSGSAQTTAPTENTTRSRCEGTACLGV